MSAASSQVKLDITGALPRGPESTSKGPASNHATSLLFRFVCASYDLKGCCIEVRLNCRSDQYQIIKEIPSLRAYSSFAGRRLILIYNIIAQELEENFRKTSKEKIRKNSSHAMTLISSSFTAKFAKYASLRPCTFSMPEAKPFTQKPVSISSAGYNLRVFSAFGIFGKYLLMEEPPHTSLISSAISIG